MARRTGREAGFLLVGVVMFVLALTILGLSLYTLSGYEADFEGQSSASSAAFYGAQGGLVLVQEVLATPGATLNTATSVIGHQNVTFAIAEQRQSASDTTMISTGDVNWTFPVRITVTTQVNNVSRTLRATYRPTPHDDYYKRLATVSEEASVTLAQGAEEPTTSLYGQIWDGASLLGGNTDPDSVLICQNVIQPASAGWRVPAGMAHMKRGPVALPDLGAYFSSHAYNSAAFVDSGLVNIWGISLSQGANPVAYYPNPLGVNGLYRFRKQLNVTITGTVVWMMPRGFFAQKPVTVDGNGTLIIVAPANGVDPFDPNAGIYFQGGLNTTGNNVRVILASDARVWIQQDQSGGNVPGIVPNLSVYGRSFDCIGPFSESHPVYQQLSYNANVMDGVIDGLYILDALPRPAGSSSNDFALVPGSWRDLTP